MLKTIIEERDFALDFLDYVYKFAANKVDIEDKILLIMIYKKWDLIILKEAIDNIDKQIKIASSMSLHDVVEYLKYKKEKFEEEFFNKLRERIRFAICILMKNYLLKKA